MDLAYYATYDIGMQLVYYITAFPTDSPTSFPTKYPTLLPIPTVSIKKKMISISIKYNFGVCNYYIGDCNHCILFVGFFTF